ncbi:MAG: NAD(P)H-dependent oxidoreductase subunit E [Cohaesibacter sp.]|nr:NAD(P)H-dependent oxidoreductase subunit E [Cohaesibacter sp.]MCV6601503.1 NAD(P)H-dependent oxidoreductase subunit E [Cohaesibacter sp.]
MIAPIPSSGAVSDHSSPLDSATEARARAICADHNNDPANLLEMLHDMQDEFGYIPSALQNVLADILNLGKAEVHGVISFYHDFRSSPAGKVVVKLCRAEACQSMGANGLIERILDRHNMSDFGTSSSGVTIEPVYCLGNCALAPAAMIDEQLLGRVSETSLDASIATHMQGGQS